MPVSNNGTAGPQEAALNDLCANAHDHVIGLLDDVDSIKDCQDASILRKTIHALLSKLFQLRDQQADTLKLGAAVNQVVNLEVTHTMLL